MKERRRIEEVRANIARLECALGMCDHRLEDGGWASPEAQVEHLTMPPPDPRPRSRR